MKKLLSILLVFALMLTLAACSKNEDAKTEDDQSPVIENPNKNEDDVIDFGSVQLTIEEEEEPSEPESPSTTTKAPSNSGSGTSSDTGSSEGNADQGSNDQGDQKEENILGLDKPVETPIIPL